jgi:hypothetical protein
MPSVMPMLRTAVVFAVAAMLLGVASMAVASPVKRTSADRAPFTTKGGDTTSGDSSFSGDGHQHGGLEGHLPGSSSNVQRVGKLELTGQFGDVVPGQIADLAVYKDFAYLNSWNEETCTRGGTYVADIRNPRKPTEIAFIPALTENYHGEGAHVISVDTRSFSGDLLAVNNEICTGRDPARGGGFDLYDVSDPANPKTLVQGFGDFGGEGKLTGSATKSKEYHSVFLWKDDGNVYLVASDDEELHDVDIFDVTNPRDPKPVNEYDMAEQFPQILETPPPYGNLVLNHDMIVKEIGGRDVLLDSYWDAGYLQIDIENPMHPVYNGDSDFGGMNLVNGDDPLVPGISPPEGNAHQAEFSFDNQYFLAADEDFNPYRADEFFVNDQLRPAAEVGGGTSVAALPDQTLSGKVVYGGYGCPADPTVLPKASDYTDAELGIQPGDERILLMQRGPSGDPSADYNGNGDLTDDACFPGEKAAKAFDAGWDAIVLINRHLGSDDSTSEPFCGSGAYDPAKPMVTVCTTHAAYHELFSTTTTTQFTTPYSPSDAPAIGVVSDGRVKGTSVFDGWGYAHLYRRQNGKVERIDSYAIPEALDPAYAFGYGDLSIHEFATDPNENLAYSSYYAGGVRVFRFGEGGIDEVGHYIDPQGNNFWGIETFVAGNDQAGNLQGERLFAGSDRDHGLWVFRYTGG